MASSTSLSYKHGVSFAEFDDPVNFTNIRDCHLEKCYIHCRRFELFIEFKQLIFYNFLELFSLLLENFNIDLSILTFIKEIHKYCIVLLWICAFFHGSLQSLLELVRYQFLEFETIWIINKAIVENSQRFVNPQSKNGKFRVTVEFIKDINSLDNFADISHVEHVMWFGRSRQEIVSNRIV